MIKMLSKGRAGEGDESNPDGAFFNTNSAA